MEEKIPSRARFECLGRNFIKSVTMKQKLVIVGCGMASGKLVEEIVSRDRERFEITVIGDEPHGNYNRIKLVNMLYSDSVDDIFIQSPEYFKDNNVNAVLGVKVAAIDCGKKYISLENKAASYLQKKMEEKGLQFFMENPVARLVGDETGVKRAFLKNGMEIPC